MWLVLVVSWDFKNVPSWLWYEPGLKTTSLQQEGKSQGSEVEEGIESQSSQCEDWWRGLWSWGAMASDQEMGAIG